MRFLLLFLCFYTFSQEKINGLSFVASNSLVTQEDISPVEKVNANWVTLMPFGFMKTINETEVKYNSKRQWLGERAEGVKQTANLFAKNEIKVMIKPQIWIPGGFTGDILMKTDADWEIFEKSYETFIFEYAKVAQETDANLFCIGTELKLFVKNRPDFFKKLIANIRLVYKGKLVYAENWDCYQDVPFWNLLDFIGIDAYFPLVNQKTPNIVDMVKAWQPIKKLMKNYSYDQKKKVIFTEFGYQSKDFTANKPWDFSEKATVNLEAQSNAIGVIIEGFWRENWFAGGFLWKWYDNYENAGGKENSDYTVQNKPAEKVLTEIYNKY